MGQGLAGIALLIAVAWTLSEDRRRVSWRVVAAGVAAQLLLAVLLLKVPASQSVFLWLNILVDALQGATRAGTALVFGYLGGGPPPFAVTDPAAGFVLAFQALPLVLLMSALSALLYHWRILPLVVRGFSWLLEKSFGIGGAVGVSSAANAFVGMVEAPLLIRPYIATVSRGELFVIMTGGMATIAGTVMVLYATFLAGVVPDPVGHLLTASVISVPAAVMIAKLMIPDEQRTGGSLLPGGGYQGSMDAVVHGTLDGVQLLINIAATLVVLVALVHLANGALGLLPDVAGGPLTLQRMMGLVLAPLAWAVGVPASEAVAAGALLGTKTVLNELLAYLELAHLPAGTLSERSRVLMTYALCGFANFGSAGIMIAGLAAMAPGRRGEIVALGMRSIVSGTLASCMTAAVVGLVL